MAKRAFLVPLAVAIAALTGNSQAAVERSQPTSNTSDATAATSIDLASRINPQAEGDLLMPIGGDIFQFVLRRAESGEMVAYHSSHQSHRSHSSHRSHYSSN